MGLTFCCVVGWASMLISYSQGYEIKILIFFIVESDISKSEQ